ncbi:unnamed protein product, partial [Ectocarpus sp. 6 AP-2014]
MLRRVSTSPWRNLPPTRSMTPRARATTVPSREMTSSPLASTPAATPSSPTRRPRHRAPSRRGVMRRPTVPRARAMTPSLRAPPHRGLPGGLTRGRTMSTGTTTRITSTTTASSPRRRGGGLPLSVRVGGVDAGPEEVCLFPSVWSEWTRTQPRKHGRVRGSGGRRTTMRRNKKRRCPRRRQEGRRRRALRRKQLARRARVGGRRRRLPTCFRGGGDSGDEGDQGTGGETAQAAAHVAVQETDRPRWCPGACRSRASDPRNSTLNLPILFPDAPGGLGKRARKAPYRGFRPAHLASTLLHKHPEISGEVRETSVGFILVNAGSGGKGPAGGGKRKADSDGGGRAKRKAGRCLAGGGCLGGGGSSAGGGGSVSASGGGGDSDSEWSAGGDDGDDGGGDTDGDGDISSHGSGGSGSGSDGSDGNGGGTDSGSDNSGSDGSGGRGRGGGGRGRGGGRSLVVKSFDHGEYTLEDDETKIRQWGLLECKCGGGVTLDDALRRFILHLVSTQTIMKIHGAPFVRGDKYPEMLWNIRDAITRLEEEEDVELEDGEMDLPELEELKECLDGRRTLMLKVFTSCSVEDTLP